MKKDEDPTLKQQKRATAYRARRDAQTPEEREEELRKQRISYRAFKARMSSEERTLAAKKAADYQRARRANETPEQRKERNSYNAWGNAVWRAQKKSATK